jgi:pimeloyl-ACP methyl ester carboxylesterase
MKGNSPLQNRRAFLRAVAAIFAPAGLISQARGLGPHLLDPQRVANYPLPPLATAQVMGRRVSYAVQGARERPLLLYFHGWGDDYSNVLPLEYPILDAGYRVLVFHRPGYRGTALSGPTSAKSSNWRSAAGQANLAKALLDQLHGGSNWRVHVLGMSGGAPAALAFAANNPRHSKGLIIQAGITRPFREAKYVPDTFRSDYTAAFGKFGWAGNSVATVVFGLMAKLRESSLEADDKIRALLGTRLEEAKQDPAFASVVSRILTEHKENTLGELNDARSIFFSASEFCNWSDIRAPALFLHDDEDPFVPLTHAKEASELISGAELRTFRLGGHIVWLGQEAHEMHRRRLEFLKATATR